VLQRGEASQVGDAAVCDVLWRFQARLCRSYQFLILMVRRV
jgi:hypothetical protein